MERSAVLVCRLGVEGRRVRVPHLEEPIGERVDDELEVAVRLLGLVTPLAHPRRLRVLGFLEKRGLVLGEEVELPVDERVEAPAAKPHRISR